MCGKSGKKYYTDKISEMELWRLKRNGRTGGEASSQCGNLLSRETEYTNARCTETEEMGGE